jgi:chromosomal replication initiator protein
MPAWANVDLALLTEVLARRIGRPRFQLWFERNARFRAEAEVLVVGVPNRHFQEWLEKTFGADVKASAEEVLGGPVGVKFRIEPELFRAARREQESAAAWPQENPLPEPPRPAVKPRSRTWRQLSTFVVGACNRVAHAAALSVTEEPGEGPNPLVIHGPVGTGKTHLLEGIYSAARKAHPDWRVSYLTSEEFTNRFLYAMRHDKLGGLRRQLRELDLLLVDDLGFLATKKATQEELLHTFDALHSEGRRMVVACDCHPRLADGFSPELTDRLLGGAVWGLTPPDQQTRLEILQAKSRLGGGPPLSPVVLRLLAESLRGNVRELEGALQCVRHYARVTGRPADVSLAREALADHLRHAVRVVSLADVSRAVCSVLRIEPGALQGKSRSWAVSHPRMAAMYLARKHTSASYSEIGAFFGGRGHSSVVAAEKKVRAWLQRDQEACLGERRMKARDLIERAERELLR